VCVGSVCIWGFSGVVGVCGVWCGLGSGFGNPGFGDLGFGGTSCECVREFVREFRECVLCVCACVWVCVVSCVDGVVLWRCFGGESAVFCQNVV
jgi:hypothetical protein